MKRVLTPIYGMALINPQLQKNTTIEVELYQKNEGNIPHIHVYTDKSNKHCALVRLDSAEYSHHHDNNHSENCTLNRNEIEELVEILSSPWSKHAIQLDDGSFKIATGYEAAVQMWVDAFGEPVGDYAITYDESGLPVMPDYTKLNK